MATRVDGALYYVHQDHLGSTVAVSDAAGGEVGRVQYDPYGTVVTSTLPADLTDQLFTGARFDGTIGLYQMGARWYDPALGRWIQPDTIVPDPGNPQALNRYAYVYNNPLKYIDPSGHGPPVPVPTPTPTPRPPFRPLPTPRRPAYYDYAPLTVDVKPHEECYLAPLPPATPVPPQRPPIGYAILATMDLFNAVAVGVAPGTGAGYEMLMPPGQASLGAASSGTGAPVVVPQAGLAFVNHHTVPREILRKYLSPDVANHPKVRGVRGSPNIWQIPEDLHIEIHQGAGGGPYNQRWIDEITAIQATGREVTVQDVLNIREKLVVEFGLEAYRP